MGEWEMATTSRGMVLEAFNAPLVERQAPVPDPEPGAIVVDVVYGGICGTDVHLHHGNLPMPTPVILGHETVGRVVKLGAGVTTDLTGAALAVGDSVAWASSIACGRCYWCLVERERTLCADRKIYGINQRFDTWPRLSGGWADSIYLQPGTAVFRLPDGIGFAQAIALGCAGPTAVHGVLHVTGIPVGSTVVVLGSGPVGIAAAMYAHLAGAAKVILVGGPGTRLDLAKSLGVGDVHIDLFTVADPAERVRQVAAETIGERGADVVLECAGVPSAVADGFAMARRNGKVLILGQYTDRGETPINPHVITRKQLTVLGSWAFSEGHYQEFVQSLPLLAARFDLARLITPYPLAEANQALADVAAGRVMKAVLTGAVAG